LRPPHARAGRDRGRVGVRRSPPPAPTVRGSVDALVHRVRLKPYPLHADGGTLSPTEERLIRWFVGLSLLLGGLVLLAEAVAFGTLQAAPLWAVLLAGIVIAILAVFTGIAEGGRRTPMALRPPGLPRSWSRCCGRIGIPSVRAMRS